MARPSAEEMFKNMIGRRDTPAAQPVQEAAAPAAEKKKASTVQVTVRLRPEQHRQLKEAAFHRDCDMSELVRQALDQFILALRPVPVAEGRILLIPHTGDDAHALPIIAHQSGAHAVLIVFLQITPKHPEQIVTGPVKTCRPLVELTKKVLIRNIIDIGAVTPRGGPKESARSTLITARI